MPKHGHIPLHPAHPKPGSDRVDILLGTPTLGTITMSWHNSMVGCVSPPNWALVRACPSGFMVADAQNILVDTLLRGAFRALLLIEDDTIPPPHTFIEMDRWLWKMERKKAPPVVSGLYHIKGSAESRRGNKGGIEQLGLEPLAYRGSGSRAFRDWTPGDVIWVSGVPTGALLIHRHLLEAWAREPDIETYTLPGYPLPLKKIFQQPSKVWYDPEGGSHVSAGTSDLWWSHENLTRNLLIKAGWGPYYERAAVRKQTESGKWPYIIDTSLRFGHVDRVTQVIY
jgi:hypothetical protein